MDKTVVVAIIGAVGLLLAAVIALIPRLLERHARREESQNAYSTKNIVRSFFRGHLSIVHETILIVVGTSIGAERYDRVLAQLLRQILANSNVEADIITDTLYQKNTEQLKSNPMICIGSRSANCLTKQYEEEFHLKDRETTAKVFTEGQRLIAFVYGGGVKETYEAAVDFCKFRMIVFVNKWSSRYTQSSKTVEIPSNIDDLLREIILANSGLGDN